MLGPYFESMVSGLEAKIATAPDQPQARRRFALATAQLGKALFGGTDKVAWCGVLAPFDLLNAMGVTSCFVEFVGATLSSSGMVDGFLEAAEQTGLGADTCGYHRAVLGAVERGLLPTPDFLVATSSPCSAGVATIESMAQRHRRDMYMLHIPVEDNAASITFLTRQIEELAHFIGAHTDQPLDPERLRAAMVASNAAAVELAEVYRLASLVPSPVRSRDLSNLAIVSALFFGTSTGVELASAFRRELQLRVDEAQSTPAPLRLLWLQNRIQFKNPLVDLLENELGATVVVDELNDITWDPIDPDEPYVGLARRAIAQPLNGPVERRIAHVQDLARRYRIDGAINPCHWGCRQGTGARGLVAAGLAEIGVPTLSLEVDCVDPRQLMVGQLRTRLEAFVEVLQSRPRIWD